MLLSENSRDLGGMGVVMGGAKDLRLHEAFV